MNKKPIDWDAIETGTEQFPVLYDFRTYTHLRQQVRTKVGRRTEYAHPPVQPQKSMAHSEVVEILSRNGSDVERKALLNAMIDELARVYASYTLQTAGRPFAVFNGTPGRTKASRWCRMCVDLKITPTAVLYYWHAVKGTTEWQGSRAIAPGYIVGDQQVMQLSLAVTSEPAVVNWHGTRINKYQAGSGDERLRSALIEAGFDVERFDATALQSIVAAADTLKQGGRSFLPQQLRAMAAWYNDNYRDSIGE